MSFFRNIKRLFGFGSEVDDEIYSDEIPEETPSSATPNLPDSTPAYTNAQGDIDPNITRQIFARVVEIVNQSLPAFFAESSTPRSRSNSSSTRSTLPLKNTSQASTTPLCNVTPLSGMPNARK